MPIELRRLLIGDTFGDYNFLRFPEKTNPEFGLYDLGLIQNVPFDKWLQRHNFGSFYGGMNSLWLRYLRFSYPGGAPGIAVSHYAPTFGCKGIARFGLGGIPMIGGFFGLGEPDGRAYVSPTGPGYYQLSWDNARYWRVSVGLGTSEGTQDLDEVRLWEALDIGPYLEELIPITSEGEVFQMPYGRYFSGSHYRWSSKRLMLTLLFPRSDTLFRRCLDAILTRPSARYPLELFVDGYLFRVAPERLSLEPVSGVLTRAILELSLLRPYGYHQDRKYIVGTPSYPSSSSPIVLNVAESVLVETPCEIRVRIGNAVSGYKVRVSVLPAGQEAVYVMDGTESFKLLSFQEDGRVLLADHGVATTVTDVTNRLEVQSRVPFVLLPAAQNVITVERLDNNNNPTSDTAYWQVGCYFNPRIGEVVGL